jgi:hypothetical protein
VTDVMAFLAGLGLVTTVAVLMLALAAHLRHPEALRNALRAHRLVPSWWTAPTATAVILAEAGVIAGVLYGALAGNATSTLRAALLGASLVFGSYAVYTATVLRVSGGRAVPCGCSDRDIPLTGWVVCRAAVLAALALVSTVGAHRIPAAGEAGTQLALVLLAGTTLAVLLWQLPAALVEPGGARVARVR